MRRIWQASTVSALLAGFILVTGCGNPETKPTVDPEAEKGGVRPRPDQGGKDGMKKGIPPIIKED